MTGRELAQHPFVRRWLLRGIRAAQRLPAREVHLAAASFCAGVIAWVVRLAPDRAQEFLDGVDALLDAARDDAARRSAIERREQN